MWKEHRYEIVAQGSYLKFSQNEDLKEKLLATGKRELVEASPSDRIWGVGFAARYASDNRSLWGLNLLGKALMETRERLSEEESSKDSSGRLR